MSAHITRRRLLMYGTAAGALAAAGILGARYLAGTSPTGASRLDPEAGARAFAEFRSRVHEDYVEGRIVVDDGWIFSQHEYDAARTGGG